jgi:cell wall-associated NlpC family hydrolase
MLLGLAAAAAAQTGPAGPGIWEGLQAVIERHLERPYVWGACGLKSYDCSGFVWRVMLESRILVKRTTARKLYMSMPAVRRQERFEPGNLVFFGNLKHCGIVSSRTEFYHSQVSRGTNLSEFDPFWRPQICGFRRMPKP